MTREEAIAFFKDMNECTYDSTEAIKMAIKALEEQTSEDCISRKAVFDALHSCFAEGFNEDRWWNSTYVLDEINKVPSIRPQPKTAHWEWTQYDSKPNFGNWHCSACRSIVVEHVPKTSVDGIPLYKYCPQCGAKMQEDDK